MALYNYSIRLNIRSGDVSICFHIQSQKSKKELCRMCGPTLCIITCKEPSDPVAAQTPSALLVFISKLLIDASSTGSCPSE